jgi:hypothetical protein
MNPTGLLYGIGSIGPFSSRIFLPALLTALLLRFGGHLPVVGHFGILAYVHAAPAWFTSNPALIVLAILSGLEIFGQKNPEIRQGLHEFDVYLKAGVAVLSSFGVISATDAGFAQAAVQKAGMFQFLGPLLALIGVLRVAPVRRQVLGLVYDHVEGTHLDHLISWAEDAGALAGTLFLILFPLLTLIGVAIATGCLFLMRRRLETAEEERRIACPHCGQSIYPSATACPACRTASANPCAVGFLGTSLPEVPDEISGHPYRLIEKRRCSVCATRLIPRKPFEPCSVCGARALTDPAFVAAYADHVTKRLPAALAFCFVLGLIPLLGLILGFVYFRIALVLPFAQYLPLGRRFMLRWGLRLLLLVLMFFQIVPLAGALIVPIMALLSFLAYRGSFLSAMATHREQPAAVPVEHVS